MQRPRLEISLSELNFGITSGNWIYADAGWRTYKIEVSFSSFLVKKTQEGDE